MRIIKKIFSRRFIVSKEIKSVLKIYYNIPEAVPRIEY